jgi:hypothetical protein
MSKTTFQQLRARCAELGITPARSVGETQERIDAAEARLAADKLHNTAPLDLLPPVETIKGEWPVERPRQAPPAKRRWPRNGGGTISQNAMGGKWWLDAHHKENPHGPRIGSSYRAARRNLGRQWRKDHQQQGARS